MNEYLSIKQARELLLSLRKDASSKKKKEDDNDRVSERSDAQSEDPAQ